MHRVNGTNKRTGVTDIRGRGTEAQRGNMGNGTETRGHRGKGIGAQRSQGTREQRDMRTE